MTSALSNYLTEVLGITRFGVDAPPAAAEKAAVFKVVFIVEKEFSPEAYTLFLKMTEAMKLKDTDYLVVEKEIPAHIQTEVCVAFDSQFSASQGTFCIPTFSPEILIQRPELKKKAWADLQKVMKQISIVEHQ